MIFKVEKIGKGLRAEKISLRSNQSATPPPPPRKLGCRNAEINKKEEILFC